MPMKSTKAISPFQFACFRILFGLYLTFHFAQLLPFAEELFGEKGILGDPQLNFTHGILPNPLEHFGSGRFVSAFLAILVALSLTYTFGIYRRSSALLLWFGWACLFNRNNLISNPSLPYVGLLLILSILVPPGEPFSVMGRNRAQEWFFPSGVYWCAWILLAIGYTFSGWAKLSSPSWIDGSALHHLIANPLARPGIFKDILSGLPAICLQLLTWSALILEILFIALSFHRNSRLIAWTSMILLHLGILLVVAFADLTVGMLMIHFFTFDPEWFPSRKSPMGRSLVLFDGVCCMCDRTVQIFLSEDHAAVLSFAPLQGKTAAKIIKSHAEISPEVKSIVFIKNYGASDETVYQKSDAVLQILNHLGGFWRVVSWLRIVPRFLRNAVYDWIAGLRYQLFGKNAVCMIALPVYKNRFLD